MSFSRACAGPAPRSGGDRARWHSATGSQSAEQRRPGKPADRVDDDVEAAVPKVAVRSRSRSATSVAPSARTASCLAEPTSGTDAPRPTASWCRRPTPPDAPVINTRSVADTAARSSMFSAVEYEHGNDASSMSVKETRSGGRAARARRCTAQRLRPPRTEVAGGGQWLIRRSPARLDKHPSTEHCRRTLRRWPPQHRRHRCPGCGELERAVHPPLYQQPR